MKVRTSLTLGISLFAISATAAQAQMRGDTQTVEQMMQFKTSQDGVVLDPNPTIGEDSRLEFRTPFTNGAIDQPNANAIATSFYVSLLEDIGITVPSQVVDFANGAGGFIGVSLTPTFELGISGEVGGYFEVDSVGEAGINVDYPMTVPVTLPAANTFACGERIEVRTQRVNGASWMEVDPPFYNLEIGPILENLEVGVNVGLKFKACLGYNPPGPVGCIGLPIDFNPPVQSLSYPINLPAPFDPLPPLLSFCEDAFAPGADMATLLACSAPGGTAPFLEFAQLILDTSAPGYTFATFEPGMVTIATPDIPTNPALSLPEIVAQFADVGAENLSFSSLDGGNQLQVAGTKSDLSEASFDLVSLIDIVTGVPTSLSLGAGLGSIDVGDIAPTLSVNQDMDFRFEAQPTLLATLETAMEWEVRSAGGGFISSGYGREVPMEPGQVLRLRYPQPLQDPTAVSNLFSMDGLFSSRTDQAYLRSLEVRALELNIPGLPNTTVLNLDLGEEQLPNSPQRIEDHAFTLGGFNDSLQVPFLLDPEKPILDISRLEVTDTLNLGRAEHAVVYRLDILNGGDVYLDQLDVLRDFAETFASARGFEVICVDSPELTPNESFDGDIDTHLLAEDNRLEVGQQSTIKMLLKVKPEISEVLPNGCFGTVDYFASSSATAFSPIGTFVTDRFDQCTGTFRSEAIVAPVDLGAAVIDGLEDYAIYGWDGVDLARGMALSAGNVGSGKDLKVLPYTAEPAGDLRIIGDLHVARDLHITQSLLEIDYLQLGRKLHRGSPGSGLVLNGTQSLDSDCVATMEPPVVSPPRVKGALKVDLAANTELPLSPGEYERVVLQEGSLLMLSAGVYDIGKLQIAGDGAIVHFDLTDGPIVLNLADWLMRPVRNVSFLVQNGSTRDVLIDYAGRKPQIFRESLVQATILAPLASLNFDEGSRLEGAAYAERVRIGPGSSFSGHAFQEPLNIDSACQSEL